MNKVAARHGLRCPRGPQNYAWFVGADVPWFKDGVWDNAGLVRRT